MRRTFPRFLPAALAVLATLLVPAAASAVTVDEIVALARAGVTDTVILALIDRDKTIFALEPDQLVALKAQGLSEPVILAMLKSGREEGDRAAQEASELRTSIYLAERSAGPEVVVIGHGPETPNASSNEYYSGASGGYYALPYYAAGAGGRYRRGRAFAPSSPGFRNQVAFPPIQPPVIAPVVPSSNIPVIPPLSRIQSQLQSTPAPAQPKTLCRAEVRGANSAFPLTTIVECPAAMQTR